jgi:hypothetical protein
MKWADFHCADGHTPDDTYGAAAGASEAPGLPDNLDLVVWSGVVRPT